MQNRVLVYAPHGRDAGVIEGLLIDHGFGCRTCAGPHDLLVELQSDAAMAIVTEEVLAGGGGLELGSFLEKQAAWSDFPFIVLARQHPGRRSESALASLRELGNLVLLERPLNPETLVSAARSALRARKRQYATREHLLEIETARRSLEQLNLDLEGRIAARTSALASANDRLMHEIAERERVQNSIVQGQKLEAIGRLTGGIAHDFNNLLQVLSINLQFIERWASNERVASYARRAKDSLARGARLTGQLLSFARSRSLVPKLHDINVILHNLRDLIEVSAGSTVDVRFALCPRPAWVTLDSGQLEMAVLNMVVNSRDAMPNGGVLTVSTGTGRLDGVDEVRLSIHDTGCGIPEAALAKIFDPFFTTKANGEGTGLGLSQVYGFAKQSGGSADVASQAGEGTTVTLSFPAAPSPSLDANDGGGDKRLPQRPGPRRSDILVVEDDAGVREGIVEGLRLLQYNVREASDGEQGFQELQRARPDLVLVDYLMPGMNGADLIARAHQLYPELPFLLATGYADMEVVQKVVGVQSVLMKPFDIETLGRAVEAELGEHARAVNHR